MKKHKYDNSSVLTTVNALIPDNVQYFDPGSRYLVQTTSGYYGKEF